MTASYNIVAENYKYTVVTEYTKEPYRIENYQSEADLEKDFIERLTRQGYEYVKIHSEKDLICNLRQELERLNNYKFTDNEWHSFFITVIANSNEGIIEKTRKIQNDYIQILKTDDNTTKNIYLIDKKNIHNNKLQVINQYVQDKGTYNNRYDVTILVNGLPLVHIELKRRGVALKEAFNQINRYKRESFWASSGLYEYIQIFVISNGTNTKYYSNTVRISHIKEHIEKIRDSQKTSNSFEFTSFWADSNNKTINDLVDFTNTFFTKHTLLNILTKYCVFTSENLLLVMRPYQIAGTERILNRLEMSINYKTVGTINAGGYIWHTTGSGKTLTSFKTAQLISKLGYIDKVLFVVDRSDLDYQTMKEYDRFAKGCANGNSSTRVLKQQLENDNDKIIITTIQKLNVFMRKNKTHSVYKKHIVFIFDECHRSQFGQMHQKIITNFKKYHLFGFTGTPIFAKNAKVYKSVPKTTEQIFGDALHKYTIVDAINDGNVLPFRIDFVNTMKYKDDIEEKQVKSIDEKKALEEQKRVEIIVDYILAHFEQKTKSGSIYTLNQRRKAGFNSIFAVSSIKMAQKFYYEFKRKLATSKKKLTVATIFSFCANEDENSEYFPEESFDIEGLDTSSREFLDKAICDYNKTFNVNFDTSSEKFQNYYKDISWRMKNKEIDILIVVNMFLTGFDATTLNTLWVDKNLNYHGLIQAFSRTNRILNSVKTYGNIVCFRNLEEEINEAIALFGDKEASSIVRLKSYEDYYYGFDEKNKHHQGYIELIEELQNNYPLGENIIGDKEKINFVKLFGTILRLRNILTSFDKFEGSELLSIREFQDYQSKYIDIYQEIKPPVEDDEKENINDDIIFEIELIKQIEVNIDYIIELIIKYHENNCKDKEILININKAIDSSLDLRSKKELIAKFIEKVNVHSDILRDWKEFIIEERNKELNKIIKEDRLKPQETKIFIENCFIDGQLKTIGTDINNIMPKMSRFGGGRAEKKENLIIKLKSFFNKYIGLV